MDDNSENDSGKVYDFKDSKTSGAVVVTKTWDDSLSNDERSVPDISISTAKPSKNPLGYTITYHGNGLTFADGTTENEIIVNSSGKILSGQYKELVMPSIWYSDVNYTNKIELNSKGLPLNGVTSDLDLYAKSKTFVLKTGSDFKGLIPSTATSVIFTDEAMPTSAALIDADADGDGGVVAWMDGTVMKVSPQTPGKQIIAATDCQAMFKSKSNLILIDFSNLDTGNVTDMHSMFASCSDLTNLDLTHLGTSNVTDMHSMFYGCSGLTDLDLTHLNTSNVTDMFSMFRGCSGLTNLDLTHLDTSNVTYMDTMFSGCSGLTDLDLTHLNTSNVTDMSSMFSGCSGLTNLDLTHLNTGNVTDMSYMFDGCTALTTLSPGEKFAFVGSDYQLPSGTWYASDGTAYTSDGNSCTIPNNKADTYTRR
ncbi:BspA family leucine-rich repeat surface protein [Blautia obeum]|uniref:Bacterial surface protein 26-residue repeat n=1 Tax=Blautia obeum TaxID=40520 RepID=A0A174W0N6_9FIRM|nr:BspA family leucine-rich repeat surface protein [Blautia obeum]CUQ38028.1 bacterial surface protein 26-residue repeat [Blautia obeum]